MIYPIQIAGLPRAKGFLPPPLRGGGCKADSVQGFRCAPPLATFRRPVGAKRRLYVACSAMMCALLLGACQGTNARPVSGPTRADTLIQVYSELQNGRFVVVADFEDPKHMDLFHLIGASEKAKLAADAKGGRAETGTGCLQFTAGSVEDAVVLTNKPDGQWYLKRDWRPYDLMLLSVHAPQRDLALELIVGAGPAEKRLSAQSALPLQRGWNTLRIDLAEVGEKIPLDDVRELKFAVSGVSKPVEVRFDDLLLTGNRVELLGDSRNTSGELYVQQVGRRWNVGAGGRFELTFAGGQIIHWYNLAADPNRVRDLVRGTALGPSPVVPGENESEWGDFSALGKKIVARQRIVEMNAVRAVVTGEWRFVDDEAGSVEGRPFQRWVYTVYPTGQLFVTVEATGRTKSWTPPGLGLAVTLAASTDDEWKVQEAEPTPGSDQSLAAAYAMAVSQPRDTAIAYMFDPAPGPTRIVEQANAQQRRVMLVGSQVGAPSETVKWVCLVILGGASELTADAAARAAEYAHPAPIRVEVGSPASGSGRARRGDGFDPAGGTFDVTPDQGRVRLMVEGQKQAMFSPVFRILDVKDQEAWVYVNHLIHSKTARDANGNLVFQLPGVMRKSTLVEVMLRRPGA